MARAPQIVPGRAIAGRNLDRTPKALFSLANASQKLPRLSEIVKRRRVVGPDIDRLLKGLGSLFEALTCREGGSQFARGSHHVRIQSQRLSKSVDRIVEPVARVADGRQVVVRIRVARVAVDGPAIAVHYPYILLSALDSFPPLK